MKKATHHKSCPWCQRMNQVLDGRPTLCVGCGHRGDVPRWHCDCPRCATKGAPHVAVRAR